MGGAQFDVAKSFALLFTAGERAPGRLRTSRAKQASTHQREWWVPERARARANATAETARRVLERGRAHGPQLGDGDRLGERGGPEPRAPPQGASPPPRLPPLCRSGRATPSVVDGARALPKEEGGTELAAGITPRGRGLLWISFAFPCVAIGPAWAGRADAAFMASAHGARRA